MRSAFLPLALALTACAVKKTESSAANDSSATVPIHSPAPAAVIPAAPTTVEANKPTPKPAKPPTAGGERDSAVQAVFEIGPDGKMRRVKR